MLIPIFEEIKGTNYFIDDTDYSIYRKGVYHTLKVKTHYGRYGYVCPLQVFFDETNGRLRSRNVSVSSILINNVFKVKEKSICVFNDISDVSKGVEIINIIDICKNWKQINDSNFFISSNGELYDDENKWLVIAHSDKNNYHYYSFNGLHKKRSHLVWEYFGSCPYKPQNVIDHIDNNPSNDNINNLQCISIRENIIKDLHSFMWRGVDMQGRSSKNIC